MAATRDYYDVLGVARDANADDIRKAFRKLARQNHPDANGGDPAATEKFKEISQAYEVLSNTDKRARYDRFGSAGVDGRSSADGFGGGGGDPFGGLFDVFFGGGRAGPAERGAEQGEPVVAEVELTLLEVLHGARKSIPVVRLEACDDCQGSGARPGTQPQPCVACGGSGAIRTSQRTILGTFSQISECYRCRGAGQMVTDPCPRCRGAGLQRHSREVQVDIPAGVEDRNQMRVRGEGNAGPHGGPRGDLYVELRVRADRRFRRQGRDVSTEVEISFARAALGSRVQVPTLEGDETLSIPSGTQPGDVFRLPGKGLPGLRQSERGDVQVLVRVKTPTRLNERQRKLLEEFASASGEDPSSEAQSSHHPGLFERVRNLFTGHDEDQAH